MVRRESLAGNPERLHAYVALAQTAADFPQALGYIEQGRQGSLAAGQSCASWDLLELSFRFRHGGADDAWSGCSNTSRDATCRSRAWPRPWPNYSSTPACCGPTAPPSRRPPMPEDALAMAEGPAAAEAGKLWTPDSPQAGGGGGKNLDPGLDSRHAMDPHELDLWHMRRALELAAAGQGFVEPNPMVGCVIARGAEIIGEGWHRRFGGDHAEVEALRLAGSRAAGATLYVTLEPCCHTGKTPPCTAAILAAGIRRVVAAMGDPFPQVAGGGMAALQAAGVAVEVGLLEAEARQLNAPYLKLLRRGLPWIIAKWAMTLDGKIATRTGRAAGSRRRDRGRWSTPSAAASMRCWSAGRRPSATTRC